MRSQTAKGALAMRMLLPMALAVLTCLVIAPKAFAVSVPLISYDGATKQLIAQTADGSATETDLFPAFKNLMSGDQREQDVELHVSGVTSEVRLYVQAFADDETARALQPVTLSASVDHGAAASFLQEGPFGNIFVERTMIARFAGNGDTVLHLQLAVPTSVSNELADVTEQVHWEITAEDDSGEITAKPSSAASGFAPGTSANLTQTGDVWGAVAVAAALAAVLAIAAMVAVVVVKRKSKS